MNGLDCVTALKALGEETRLRMLRLLCKEPMSVTNISKHLRVMREAGLLEIEKRGQQRLYTVSARLKSQLASNIHILDSGCCTFRLDKLPE